MGIYTSKKLRIRTYEESRGFDPEVGVVIAIAGQSRARAPACIHSRVVALNNAALHSFLSETVGCHDISRLHEFARRNSASRKRTSASEYRLIGAFIPLYLGLLWDVLYRTYPLSLSLALSLWVLFHDHRAAIVWTLGYYDGYLVQFVVVEEMGNV